ncbi:hypothetical protein KKA15_05365 [Patescibacteria group bacterium]|nr:hypothetical protein [Patescibacteria group bacterium]
MMEEDKRKKVDQMTRSLHSLRRKTQSKGNKTPSESLKKLRQLLGEVTTVEKVEGQGIQPLQGSKVDHEDILKLLRIAATNETIREICGEHNSNNECPFTVCMSEKNPNKDLLKKLIKHVFDKGCDNCRDRLTAAVVVALAPEEPEEDVVYSPTKMVHL